MYRAWASRFFFSVVAVMALAALVSGTACTRWGKPSAIPATLQPLSMLYVNPTTGSDSSGNGTQSKPYRTLTKAVDVLETAKLASGVTISLAPGDYTAANGEKFPIVIPKAVTLTGMNFGNGPRGGTFIDGFGQDTLFEQTVHAPAKSAYTTLEIAPGITVTMSEVYLGASKLKLPNSHAGYWSLDVLGNLMAELSNFGGATVSTEPSVSGALLAGGTLNCTSCEIRGNDFGIGALSVTVPVSTAYPTTSPSTSPSSTPTSVPSAPSVTLTHLTGDSTVAAKVVDLITDGSIDVTVSGERFERGQYAFEDSLQPIVGVPVPGAVDFGGGFGGSTGGNIFLGARVSEISIVRRNETITALDDTWNPLQQGAGRSGGYKKTITFRPGARGKNVSILHNARGSTVTVGPAVVPTPSASPSTSPSPT
ncbi:MAG TPA: DUF1565 domain-containing protein [Candidatus Cybelea sp.]|nr:DUF1565 domain-containing protein [Candidatus Cybelea sp.]